MSRRRSAAATPVTIQRKAHHIASPVQALVLPKKEAAAFLKAYASADPECLETVPEACAAMLCTAKAGLQQRQARPIMSMDTAQLSAAGKLAMRLVEVEVRLLRSWQAAAAEALQGEPELLWAGTEVGACGLQSFITCREVVGQLIPQSAALQLGSLRASNPQERAYCINKPLATARHPKRC